MKYLALVAGLASFLSACSGEGFEVKPCLVNGGKLAFELGTVKGWFGVRETPHYANVWFFIRYSGAGNLWSARPNSNQRRFVMYGFHYPGWTVDKEPGVLKVGQKYSVTFSGLNAGMADFTYGPNLPQCRY